MGDKNAFFVGHRRRLPHVVFALMVFIALSSLKAPSPAGGCVDCSDLPATEQKELRGRDESRHKKNESKHQCNFLMGHGAQHQARPQLLSQGAQDVVLEEIFQHIGETNKEAVEFGFGYSKGAYLTMDDLMQNNRISSGLNIHRLVQKGFKPTFFDALIENPKINLRKAVLTQDNIVQEFEKAGISKDADFISIDVDSVDIWLLHAMLKGGYKPRVVSVEYNSNFEVDQLIACEPKWAPWKQDGTVFGASAGAINYVAKQFGYVPVAVVTLLDVFLVREDILRDTCDNFDELPSFETLAKESLTGMPHHRFCRLDRDASRLVDVPLFLEGKEEESRKKAQEAVDHLNQARKARGQRAFCDQTTSY